MVICLLRHGLWLSFLLSFSLLLPFRQFIVLHWKIVQLYLFESIFNPYFLPMGKSFKNVRLKLYSSSRLRDFSSPCRGLISRLLVSKTLSSSRAFFFTPENSLTLLFIQAIKSAVSAEYV